ncbi:MAG: hypothetical protein SNJ56_02000 [Termitinemataceae bacterium]
MYGNQDISQGALVQSQAQFRPVFLSPVSGDPDVQYLSVTLSDLDLTPVSQDIIYTKIKGEQDQNRLYSPNFDTTLPTFALPEHIPIGFYYFNLRIHGNNGVLSEKRIPFYYLKDALFTVKEIRSYPPGIKPSESAPLFPPTIKLLLESVVDTDPRIDPYIIWYAGNRPFSQGRIAEGAHRVLWETPASEGFVTIRCELYPEPPRKSGIQLPYLQNTLKIAVSKTAPTPGFSSNIFSEGSSSQIFHFLGTLSSEDSDDTTKLSFQNFGNSDPLWTPVDDSYGITIGTSYRYKLEQPLLPVKNTTISDGTFYLRIASYSQTAVGTVFSTSYETIDNQKLIIELQKTAEGHSIIVRLGDLQNTLNLPRAHDRNREFSLQKISLKQRGNTLSVTVEEKNSTGKLEFVLPAGTYFSDKGEFWLGPSIETVNNKDVYQSQTQITMGSPSFNNQLDNPETTQQTQLELSTLDSYSPFIAIIDELAVVLHTTE